MQHLRARPDPTAVARPGQCGPAHGALPDRRVALLLVALLSACAPQRDEVAKRPGSTPFPFPYVDPQLMGATPAATAAFTGMPGGSAGAPRIAYPLDGAMHPLNIGSMTFQWTRGDTSSRVFRIRVSGGATPYDFYVPCLVGTQCLFTPPPAGWLTIAKANPNGQLTATVAGTDGRGGLVYQSPPIVIRFTPEAVTGGLYYWSAPETQAATAGTTYRLPFGATTAIPFITPGTLTNPRPCGGCHSVSRNGAVISFAATDEDQSASKATLAVAPTHTPEQETIVPTAMNAPNARFTALNSDGSLVATTVFGHLQIYATAYGTAVDIGAPESLLPTGKLLTHPEWSPNGRRIAFTLYSTSAPDGSGTRSIGDTRPEDGQIATLELDPDTGKVTRLRVILVPSQSDGMAHYYPSWSPDEHWLVVTAVPRGTSVYSATGARLRLVSADSEMQTCPGATCFDLANASQGTDASSTWAKVTPFSQANKTLIFVAFSSKADYGLVLANKGPNGAQRAQLWMSAIDLSKATVGSDPSFPPIWLPFQNITQTNHLPFWTTAVTCASAGTVADACGDGQVCRNGICETAPR